MSKIIPALQSRCTRFRFAPLKPDQIRGRMKSIIMAEGLTITEDAQEALLDLSGGNRGLKGGQGVRERFFKFFFF